MPTPSTREVKKYGALPRYIGVARDTLDDARNMLRSAMECDIIITTGGVSMGKVRLHHGGAPELGIKNRI